VSAFLVSPLLHRRQVRMRSMWEKYYTEANAVIYVVDSADVSRLEEAKNTFGRKNTPLLAAPTHDFVDRLFEDESLMKSETPLITFANKQDLPVPFHLTLLHDSP
jgi:ADP-ribosylation factor related protein 1